MALTPGSDSEGQVKEPRVGGVIASKQHWHLILEVEGGATPSADVLG